MPRKQMEIPGTEPERIEALECAIEQYAQLEEEKQSIAMQHRAQRERLIMLLREHELSDYSYRDAGREVRVRVTAKQALECLTTAIDE